MGWSCRSSHEACWWIFYIKRGTSPFYFPIVTSIIVSVVLSAI
ncbi:DUF2905 family protein [Bacillus sp. 1P06AnD]